MIFDCPITKELDNFLNPDLKDYEPIEITLNDIRELAIRMENEK